LNPNIIVFGPWVGEFTFEISWWAPEIRLLRNTKYQAYKAIHVGYIGRSGIYKDFVDEYIPFTQELHDSIDSPDCYLVRNEDDERSGIQMPRNIWSFYEDIVNSYKQKLYIQLVKDGVVVTDEIRIAIDKLAAKLKPLYEEIDIATEAFELISGAVNKAFSTMENSIIGLIKGTKSLKDTLKTIMQQFIADMTVAILKLLILNRLKRMIMDKVGGSIQEGIGKAILGAIFKRQSGGAVNPKTPYMVGEKGPELFIPNSSGRVAPTYHAGNMATANTKPPIVVEQHINFTTGIQPTVRAEVMNLLPQIQNSTIAAVQEARVRGGKFAESFGG